MFEFLVDYWNFVRTHGKFWLWPLVLLLALVGGLLVVAQGSAIAPFIYTLF